MRRGVPPPIDRASEVSTSVGCPELGGNRSHESQVEWCSQSQRIFEHQSRFWRRMALFPASKGEVSVDRRRRPSGRRWFDTSGSPAEEPKRFVNWRASSRSQCRHLPFLSSALRSCRDDQSQETRTSDPGSGDFNHRNAICG